MKKIVLGFFLTTHLNFVVVEKPDTPDVPYVTQGMAENVFIITTDGFRWQEVFSGADSVLINDQQYTQNTELANMYFGAATAAERRQKLMPFFWNVIAQKGVLLGNRNYDNMANVQNIYGSSYPGYNELLTGTTDISIYNNSKKNNPHKNILELLNDQERFKNKVAVVTSWDVFPYILNEDRSKIPVNSGYTDLAESSSQPAFHMINEVQQKAIAEKEPCRYDLLTFAAAKEYIKMHQPKLMYISLGETDEWAHSGRYDLYLQQANQFDKYVSDLWYYVQTNEYYKNKTAFIITTDHGRGYLQRSSWKRHGPLTPGSKDIWMAMIGPGIEAKGELKEGGKMIQKNTSSLIAKLLGVTINSQGGVATGQPVAFTKVVNKQ
jgi:hypothetical protein